MKSFVIVLIRCMSLFISCSKSRSRNTETASYQEALMEKSNIDKPYLHFKNDNVFDFGIVRSGVEIIPVTFEIENKGNMPLVIYNADVSCGCISIDIPKEPIFPKESAIVHVKINAKNQQGYFNNTVFINSNAVNDVEVLHLKGEIIK